MKFQKLPDSELLIMKILWKSESPISSNDIFEKLQDEKDWKITTVLTLLSRLVDKQFVGYEKKGRAYDYYSLVPEKEYLQTETDSFLKLLHNGSLKSLFASLCDSKGIEQKDIDDLKRWLEERGENDV